MAWDHPRGAHRRRGQFTLSRLLLAVTTFGLFCGSLRLFYLGPSVVSAMLVFSLGVLALDLPLARFTDVLHHKLGRTCALVFDAFCVSVMIAALLAILAIFIPQLER